MAGDAAKGNIQFGAESADEGKVITIDLSWEGDRITVSLRKGEGTISAR